MAPLECHFPRPSRVTTAWPLVQHERTSDSTLHRIITVLPPSSSIHSCMTLTASSPSAISSPTSPQLLSHLIRVVVVGRDLRHRHLRFILKLSQWRCYLRRIASCNAAIYHCLLWLSSHGSNPWLNALHCEWHSDVNRSSKIYFPPCYFLRLVSISRGIIHADVAAN